jgi:RNA polymerase sigma factor (sigma-70 family)
MPEWKELVDKCAPMVISISWRILGDATDVEDNVQDVFLEACRLDREMTVRNWPGLLRRLATFGALAKRRQRRRHAPLTEVLPPDKKTPSPDAAAIRKEEEANLRDAIAALPPREGAAFTLRYFENLELPEIAVCLGISYTAAGAALSRAKAKLTRLLAEPEKKTDAYRKIREKHPALLGRAQPGIA